MRDNATQAMESEQYSEGSDVSDGEGSTINAETKAESEGDLMEQVCKRQNLKVAYYRVMKNKGAAGVDGMVVTQFKDHLQRHWPLIKEKLLAGSYIPQPIRQVEIPKPQGGERLLGIPTLTDRLIQQAMHQVLSPIFEATFSDSSYGYRKGRSAHDAVKAAKAYISDGRPMVVDIDLEQFFDHMNHNVLMDRVARKVRDKRVLKLIRRYLKAGVMIGGVCSPRTKGAPQGGPLSPLLSNILLTDLDRELERRGHAFCRYADDCQVYVRSRRAGERVLAGISEFLANRLKLKVNHSKSAVGTPLGRQFLGYSVYVSSGVLKLRVSTTSIVRLTHKLRQVFRHSRGRSLKTTIEQLNPILRGWSHYFHVSASMGPLKTLDGWIRHRLRCLLWRQWKRNYTRAMNLMKAGLDEARSWHSATNGRGPWWNSGASHMNQAYRKSSFDRLGLVSILETVYRLQNRL